MQMHGHELHLPLHLDAYLHCVYPGSEQSIVAKMKQMKLKKSGATLTMVEAAGSLPVAPRGSSSEAGFVMVASEKKVLTSATGHIHIQCVYVYVRRDREAALRSREHSQV